ncbi:MAG: hypothetical protein ABJE95_38385 [Byssovorax sp.]
MKPLSASRAALAGVVVSLLLAAAPSCVGELGDRGAGSGGHPGAGGSAPVPPVDEIPFEAQAPESYVGRVKNLVTGGAVTADELAAVKADPSALAGLVDGWMKSPTFDLKLMELFKVALQQTNINHATIQDQNGEELFSNPVRLFANLQEMAARTAVDVVEKGEPWSRIVNTRQLMMTTAVASYLLYLDVDYGEIVQDKHTFYHQPPAGMPAPPWSMDFEMANKVWWTDEDFTVGPANKSCPDPWQLSSFWLLNFMHGALHCNGYYHHLQGRFTDSDYTDWRLITVAPASGEHAPLRFYDAPALEKVSTLYLRQPRVGFFTTPAFFATWPTNDSNSSRVVANQTLIVALGKSINPENVTVPTTDVGLGADHATPGTSCYGCHRTLDPMRNYFRQSYQSRYRPQGDQKIKDEGAAFGFDDVVKDGGSILDFADTLAAHPDLAPAWVQKLCFYANSVGCDAEDPEFQRVVKAFRDSGLDFKTMVRELYSSPLVTGAKRTLTWSKQAFPISIMRRQHICALLSERLGVSNACDPMIELDTYGNPKFSDTARLVHLLPNDGFGRGAERPFLATLPDMFFRGNMEAICQSLATQLIDAPGTLFASADSATAVSTLVHTMMGLPEGDARAPEMRAILEAHLVDARAAGADDAEALRSTFTLACTSPFTASLGF